MKKLLFIPFLLLMACHKPDNTSSRQSASPVPVQSTKQIKFIVDANFDSCYVSIAPFDYPNSVGLLMNNFTHTFITNQPARSASYLLQAQDHRMGTYTQFSDSIRIRAYLDGVMQSDTKIPFYNYSSIFY